MFVGTSILFKPSVDCNECATGTTYVLISCEDLSNITTRVLVQLLVVAKDYDGDIDGTEDGKLMRLLEKTAFALEKGSIDRIALAIILVAL